MLPTNGGTLNWMSLTSTNHWQVGLAGCKIGTTNMTMTSTDAILDSGTSLTFKLCFVKLTFQRLSTISLSISQQQE